MLNPVDPAAGFSNTFWTILDDFHCNSQQLLSLKYKLQWQVVVRVFMECSIYILILQQHCNQYFQAGGHPVNQSNIDFFLYKGSTLFDIEARSVITSCKREWNRECLSRVLCLSYFVDIKGQNMNGVSNSKLDFFHHMCFSLACLTYKVMKQTERQMQAGGQTVEACGKQREKDSVTVNNELRELFTSPILPVFREVSHPLGCRLIDF